MFKQTLTSFSPYHMITVIKWVFLVTGWFVRLIVNKWTVGSIWTLSVHTVSALWTVSANGESKRTHGERTVSPLLAHGENTEKWEDIRTFQGLSVTQLFIAENYSKVISFEVWTAELFSTISSAIERFLIKVSKVLKIKSSIAFIILTLRCKNIATILQLVESKVLNLI